MERLTTSFAKNLKTSTALIALFAAHQLQAQQAQAQTAAPQLAQSTPSVEEITVTGSRIVRDGYEAPTPVSVLGAEELNKMAVTNIADAVQRLPAVTGSRRSSSSPGADITGGISDLNLRGLGSTRTLVLLDGKRVSATSFEGAVDINGFPNGLVSRVDTVTGGASAVYGSDALAGVVNFVLDTEYTGIKGSAQGGITTYGDDESYKVDLTFGTPFAGGRGHFLLAGENAYTQGILQNNRDWSATGYQLLNNPRYTAANGEPFYITAFDAGLSVATRGGLITSGPLKGTSFGAGGAPLPFTYGVVTGIQMIGGDHQISRIDNDPMLDLRIARTNGFTRVSYDLADNVNIFAEALWSHTRSKSLENVPQFHLGNITVFSGNPFIPATVQASMTALGLTQFTLGSTNQDMPTFGHNNGRTVRRYVAGATGNFDAFETNWTWDASYVRSSSHISARSPGTEVTANYTRANDAVRDPVSGRIVCRSTLTDPTNGCVPYNVMGIGVNSAAAIDYVTETGYTLIRLVQDVASVSASGEPFSTWAGPVSLAFGGERRREQGRSIASALDQARAFFAGNYTESQGRYTVTEGFIETVVPLAQDADWARSFEINAAVRATDYSTSGYVTTWKIGATYKPIDDLTFRATRSRDIRAPGLGELYNTGRSGTGAVTDPATGVQTTIVTRTQGNPLLLPEKANTTGIGFVYQPSWFDGLGASIDFYDIKINGAIASYSAQQYVNRCFAGETVLCPFIERNPATGFISFVAVRPANVALQAARGFDFETSYNFPLSDMFEEMDGSITLRALATYVTSLKTVDNGVTIQGAGVSADSAGIGVANALFSPEFRYILSADYSTDAFSASLTARGVDPGVYNNAFIQCTAQCPTSTTANPTINNNRIEAVMYFDLALNYKIMDEAVELFFVAENMFNRDPPLVAAPTNAGYWSGQGNGDYYDILGRIFRAGVRFQY